MPLKTSNADLLRIMTLLLFVILIIYSFLYVFIPKSIPTCLYIGTPSRKINLLIIGLDYSYDEKHNIAHENRSDTMMLCHIDPLSNKISILSIPRDSKVEIPGHEINKINSAYAFGKINLAKETVSKYLGITIDNYLIMEPSGLINLIDAIGGLKINIENDMYYKDNWGHLYINLKKGIHKLNGKEVQGYVRFRHDALGDISRIKRQQYFLNALFKKLASPIVLIRSPLIISSAKKTFQTDLSFKDIIMIGNLFRLSKNKNIIYNTLPGNFSTDPNYSGFWIPDEEKKKQLLQDMGIR